MIKTLEQRGFPVDRLVPLDVAAMAGSVIRYQGTEVVVGIAEPGAFGEVDIALFSAGEQASTSLAPEAVKEGAIVVDNSSAWRMDPNVPLVVPEVNPQALDGHKGLIANPNCSTIQMVVVLKPLHDYATIKRVVVSTYQAVSGTGLKAMDELVEQTRALLSFKEPRSKVYPHRIAFNVLPHIDAFLENGYTKEEMKMVNETRKIMEDYSIGVSATTVRVPVLYGHSESVNVEFLRAISPDKAREILSEAPGVRVVDDVGKFQYPMAIDAAGQDDTLVGRIRQDESVEHGLNMWIVADNVRKGAATNAVQIAEILIDKYL
jgi:aspartate-semialdehyde dehydrogenase